MNNFSLLFNLSNATTNPAKETRGQREYRHVVHVIFCKFLVGNSGVTNANELRNTDITEFRCLDFSNVNIKFLTLRSLNSEWHSCENEKKCHKESKVLFTFGLKKKQLKKVSNN